MFHNGGNLSFSCSEMSATSTPHRHARGVQVPYIDTKAPMPKATTTLQCGWLTPPQSAHESRRPSLAYSTYSDMPYSAASTATAFSMPSTPNRGNPQHDNHGVQSFSQEHLDLELTAPLSSSHLSQDLIHLNLESQSSCTLSGGDTWSTQTELSTCQDEHSQHFGPGHPESLWPDHHMAGDHFLHQPTGLHSTLFPMSHDLPVGQHIVPQAYDTTSNSFDSNGSTMSTLLYNTMSGACYQSPEIVEPSLVNPHNEYADQHYSMLESPESSPQELSASFASGFSSSYEEIRTPDAEVDYCEEIDGWNHVKEEVDIYPPSPVPSKPLPIRTKLTGRRSSKRVRKAPSTQQRTILGIQVTLKGDGVGFDNGEFVRTEHSPKGKPYTCPYVSDHGIPCKTAFARSEHLKRHLSKHSDVRQYPCVLPKCDKKISRSDNACDHFRTHLMTKERNKRNAHFHWREVERRIRYGYDEKRAGKLIMNLERWMEKKCLENNDFRDAHMEENWDPNKNPEPLMVVRSD